MPTNSSAWGKFRRQAETELAQLHQLFEIHAPLIVKCRDSKPDLIECSALGTLLHSFYTGIENILKRVTVEIDRSPVEGASWHQLVLQRAAEANERRPAVISESLRSSLQDYLGFRHFFRNAYSHTLDWAEMESLVLDCERTLQQFHEAISTFLTHEPPSQS